MPGFIFGYIPPASVDMLLITYELLLIPLLAHTNYSSFSFYFWLIPNPTLPFLIAVWMLLSHFPHGLLQYESLYPQVQYLFKKRQLSLTLCTENVVTQGGGWFKKVPKPLYVICIKNKDDPLEENDKSIQHNAGDFNSVDIFMNFKLYYGSLWSM